MELQLSTRLRRWANRETPVLEEAPAPSEPSRRASEVAESLASPSATPIDDAGEVVKDPKRASGAYFLEVPVELEADVDDRGEISKA